MKLCSPLALSRSVLVVRLHTGEGALTLHFDPLRRDWRRPTRCCNTYTDQGFCVRCGEDQAGPYNVLRCPDLHNTEVGRVVVDAWLSEAVGAFESAYYLSLTLAHMQALDHQANKLVQHEYKCGNPHVNGRAFARLSRRYSGKPRRLADRPVP